jgi:hypothetical protein
MLQPLAFITPLLQDSTQASPFRLKREAGVVFNLKNRTGSFYSFIGYNSVHSCLLITFAKT